MNAAGWAINSALGLPTAVVLWIAGKRVPVFALHALLVIGAGTVALGMVFGDGGAAAVATSFFFVWVALYAFWFLNLRVALVHLLLDALLFATILFVVELQAGPAVWLLVAGTASVVGVVVALMHRQLMHATTIAPLRRLPTRLCSTS